MLEISASRPSEAREAAGRRAAGAAGHGHEVYDSCVIQTNCKLFYSFYRVRALTFACCMIQVARLESEKTYVCAEICPASRYFRTRTGCRARASESCNATKSCPSWPLLTGRRRRRLAAAACRWPSGGEGRAARALAQAGLPLGSHSSQPLTSQPLTSQPLPSQPLTSQPLTSQPLTSQPLPSQRPAAEWRPGRLAAAGAAARHAPGLGRSESAAAGLGGQSESVTSRAAARRPGTRPYARLTQTDRPGHLD